MYVYLQTNSASATTSEGTKTSNILGEVETVLGKITGCEGMKEEGEERKPASSSSSSATTSTGGGGEGESSRLGEYRIVLISIFQLKVVCTDGFQLVLSIKSFQNFGVKISILDSEGDHTYKFSYYFFLLFRMDSFWNVPRDSHIHIYIYIYIIFQN